MALNERLKTMSFDDTSAAHSSLAPGATGGITLTDAMAFDRSNGIEDDVLISDDLARLAQAQALSNSIESSAPVDIRRSETKFHAGDGTVASPFEVDDDDEDVHDLSFQPINGEQKKNDVEVISGTQDEPQSTHRLVPINTGYVYTPRMMLHVHPSTELDEDDDENEERSPHPEAPERIKAIYSKLVANGCIRKMKHIQVREAIKSEISLVHEEDVWDGVERTQAFGYDALKEQTVMLEARFSLYINQHSAVCARLSCGGVIEMCDAVARGDVRNGFAIVRPPGHHAEPSHSMGFCFYNNVAVATRFLQRKYGEVQGPTRCKRIMILDWDVHHGNGTQSAFWDNGDVLYVSIHRYDDGEFYPCGRAGNFDRVGGEGAGLGRNVNIPWPTGGMGDGEYMAAFLRIVMPIAVEFAPDLVIVSAGFDAARGDQLGQCLVTPAGYAHMTHSLASLANGRLVVALEGGYNIDAIAASALEVTKVLLGEPPIAMEDDISCELQADAVLRAVEHAQSPYWKCMRPPELRTRPTEDDGQDRVKLSELLAQYRANTLRKRYKLIVVPMRDAASVTGFGLEGSCLCTQDLLNDNGSKRAVVVFVHDFGNLRLNAPTYVSCGPDERDAEMASIVDSSTAIIEWAQASNMSLIDLSLLNTETPSDPQTAALSVAVARRQARRHAGASAVEQRAQQHLEALLHVWDNLVLLLAGHDGASQVNVVLVGLGTGCQAVTNLVESRRVPGIVKAVVQLPCYGTVPTTPKGEVRKWYFRRSRVFLPHEHSLFLEDEDVATTAKRFGKLIRSREARALHVFRAELDAITSFVDASLPAATVGPSLGAAAPVAVNSNGHLPTSSR